MEPAFNNPNDLPAPLTVDTKTAAHLLGVSARTVWGLADTGALPVVRIGRRKLFRLVDLSNFVAARAGREGGQQ